jgi:hypothetical protein
VFFGRYRNIDSEGENEMSEKGKKASLAVHSEAFPQTVTIQAHAENEWFEDWMDYCDAEDRADWYELEEWLSSEPADAYC